jgi:hypothetical protein
MYPHPSQQQREKRVDLRQEKCSSALCILSPSRSLLLAIITGLYKLHSLENDRIRTSIVNKILCLWPVLFVFKDFWDHGEKIFFHNSASCKVRHIFAGL